MASKSYGWDVRNIVKISPKMTKKQSFFDFFSIFSQTVHTIRTKASQKEKDLSRLLYRTCGSGFVDRSKWSSRCPIESSVSVHGTFISPHINSPQNHFTHIYSAPCSFHTTLMSPHTVIINQLTIWSSGSGNTWVRKLNTSIFAEVSQHPQLEIRLRNACSILHDWQKKWFFPAPPLLKLLELFACTLMLPATFFMIF